MKRKPKISYFNDIITFDIESTNYVEYKNVKHRDGTVTKEVDKKYAWMYLGDFCRFVCGNPSHGKKLRIMLTYSLIVVNNFKGTLFGCITYHLNFSS